MTDRKLYQFGDSPCCMKVRMVLAAKSLPWDEVFIESWKFDHFQPEYLELNPSGTVPTFVEDGQVVSESNKIPLAKKILKGLYTVATSVKQGKVSYSENNGQYLPGYTQDIGFLGGAPTSFAFGSQVDIRNTALQNGWLVGPRDPNNSEYYNKTYSRTQYNKLDYTFTLKPIKDLNIDIRGNQIKTRDLSQQLDVVENGSSTGALDFSAPAFETGNFSTSHAMIATAFTDGDALFQTMKAYRSIIANRLAKETGAPIDGFGSNSQQVLLPAFMAAYSGSNPDKINTGLFRNIPIKLLLKLVSHLDHSSLQFVSLLLKSL